MKKLIIGILGLFSLLVKVNATTCHGSFVNPIADVCWSCIFPITIGDKRIVSSEVKDNSENPSDLTCACLTSSPKRIGLTLGFWEPIHLVDVTRTPFCLVNLGGLELNIGDYGMGSQRTFNDNENGSFYYVHWYRYPLLYWLNLILDAVCLESGDLDIAYLTELDPTWHDDDLAFILNPEAILFANPIAQAACAADSVASSLHGPLDKLFWCAGSQGSMYPLAGEVQAHVGGVQASLLLAERMAYKMHREYLSVDSVGKNAPAICSIVRSPFLPKSRYRYQMVNPIPTTGRGGCYPLGATTTTWESTHAYPVKGEDFGYLIWRKRNCCLGVPLP